MGYRGEMDLKRGSYGSLSHYINTVLSFKKGINRKSIEMIRENIKNDYNLTSNQKTRLLEQLNKKVVKRKIPFDHFLIEIII